MRIADILRTKGSDVVTISSDRTVLEAVKLLVEHSIGAAVVSDSGNVVGILSERDILRLTALGPERVGETTVAEVMSTELVTTTAGDDLGHVMDLMTTNRVRHLPVLEGSDLAGLVSIGDVVNALRSESESAAEHLKQYIAGRG